MRNAMVNALAYEPDKQIVDVEDPPSRPRVATQELTMQVLHDGAWHRRLPDLSATACGSKYHSQFSPSRREELRHPLCETCHTPIEVALADKADLDETEGAL